MNRRTMLTTATVALASASTLGLGAGEASAATQASFVDTTFILEAAQALQLEIALANVAKTRATRADVKAYATQVATDLTKQLKLLKAQATALGVTLPTQTDPTQQALVDALGKVATADVDFQYIFQQVNDLTTYGVHNGLFDRGRVKAQAKGLRSYFAHALPVIRKELNAAQAILTNLPGGTAALA
jgi:predicted outer membrane protein